MADDDQPKHQPAPEGPIKGIEAPGPADLGLSEGRKGMVMMPADGDPSNLADVFASIDSGQPIDSFAPADAPEPAAPMPSPPSDSE
jgi:hypothetical protein